MLEIVWAKRAVHQWETFAKKDFRAVDSWDHNLDIKKLVGTAEWCLRNKKKNHEIIHQGAFRLILKCVFWIDWEMEIFAVSTYADFGLVGEFRIIESLVQSH